ncbi:MAG: ribosomal-processing cysteine protease Prp [Erysipelothrix sp.]|nr:ribosomal-processing cysteine protease Prp [Erysipelothrix sp.]
MIKVNIYTHKSNIYKIDISGHSYSGEPGYDLVCAGVSSIGVGALNAFDALDDDCILELSEKPYIKIECKTITKENQTMMNFLKYQLETVEAVHHEHIRIKEMEDSR